MTHFIAALQMTSGPVVSANLDQAAHLIHEAAQANAQLIVLPENFAFMGTHPTDAFAIAETPGSGPLQTFLAHQARLHRLWIIGGTLPIHSPFPDKVYARCGVYNPQGHCVANYDKLHLFDVEAAVGERYCESDTFVAGQHPVCVPTPLGLIGLGICYDLRFPELFRQLAAQGMELLAVPSAFTATTGQVHWEVLVRARAIENLCYVVAANQSGHHPVTGRATHGHSMVVDFWGTVLSHWPEGPGIAIALLDQAALHDRRRRFPALQHRRLL